MPFHRQVLPNGLTVIGETNPAALATAVGFFVRTGSRDETADEAGVSHFLEHMVFKGTPRRTSLDVNRDLDRIGADSNAYTSEENTVFYGTVLPEYLPQLLDILADIMRPSLRGDDFDTEKGVILQEIAMYEDQPLWPAFDRARKAFYADHPLGNSVLGTTASITALSRDQMQAYYDRRYVAPNILAVAAGNYDWDRFLGLVSEKCSGWPTGTAPRQHLREATGRGGLGVFCKETVTQEHLVLLSAGPPAESKMRYAADLLATAVGDDSGSRLYWALVDPGDADGADLSYHENQAAGLFGAYVSGDPENAAANLDTVRRVLREVQRDGITSEELQQAKSKVLSRVVRGHERTRSRMLALGSYWTYLNDFHEVDAELKAFDSVTLDDVRDVLDHYPLDAPTGVAYGPLSELDGVRANGSG